MVTTIEITATPQATPAGHWSFKEWLGCPSATQTTCTMTRSILASDVTYSPRAVFIDRTGPTIQEITPTYSEDKGESLVSFGLKANEPLLSSSRDCHVDGVRTECGAARKLSEGTHTVKAQVKDLSGNQGPLSSAIT